MASSITDTLTGMIVLANLRDVARARGLQFDEDDCACAIAQRLLFAEESGAVFATAFHLAVDLAAAAQTAQSAEGTRAALEDAAHCIAAEPA